VRPSELKESPTIAILLLNNSGMGGAERRLVRVYAELKRRRFPVVLGINQSLLQRCLEAGVLHRDSLPAFVLKPWAETLSFALRKLDYLLGCFSIGWWLIRLRPKAMHLVLGGAYVVLPLQILGLAPPAVVSVVGPLRDMVGSRFGLWLFRRALRRAHVVDALSETVRETLRREGVGADHIRVPAGSSVDTERFRPADQKRPLIVFCGRLIPEKQPTLFLEACRIVRDRLSAEVHDLRFLVLGDGPLRHDVDQLVVRHGLAPWITIGWSPQVESVLSEALIFASLQRTDNYPSQALLEAMACGAAVVATDVGLTARLVDPAVGRRVEPAPAKIAEAMIELLENPARTKAMGLRARDRVVREHSMEAYLNYLEQIYLTCGFGHGQRCAPSNKTG
jgi:glycosyltransferase involved in cell wall biosynthesis